MSECTVNVGVKGNQRLLDHPVPAVLWLDWWSYMKPGVRLVSLELLDPMHEDALASCSMQ